MTPMFCPHRAAGRGSAEGGSPRQGRSCRPGSGLFTGRTRRDR